MNAESLIGTVLGTCTLQRLLGQGGMGAVFLAQQSRPRRQVAVKVLMPMTLLNAHQLAAFLERFRRETDAAASLEHPNIVPVHEYGERDGLAYLVMPYISGGTLRDEMEREGVLPLAKIVNYLDQMAAALDFAHEHGVIHRDIKPANILMTPEGRLLLTDFGLVKIVSEGHNAQPRLTGVGVPVGTPDYMAPEQVMGEGVDSRADLYSLGVILYQMVTGTTPFQGETPMQIAAQHLQIPPPSPQMLRPDLPVATEQVILRSLAKRPSERYATARELADAFRLTLIGMGIPLSPQNNLLAGITGARIPVFEEPALALPTSTLPAIKANRGAGLLSRATGMAPAVRAEVATTGQMPVAQNEIAKGGGGLLSRTGKFPQVGTAQMAAVTTAQRTSPATEAGTAVLSPIQQMSPIRQTGQLPATGQPMGSNTIKLTSPVKVVQVPVAGQPGQYVTGLLPVMQQIPTTTQTKKPAPVWMKAVSVLMALILLAGIVGAVWFIRMHTSNRGSSTQSSQTGQTTQTGKLNVQATAIAQATATAQANTILFDPLSTNTHSWLTAPANVYAFKDGAYHITDRGDSGRATVLQGKAFGSPLGYTLTMDEITGDDNSAVNSFGMILRFNQQTKNGKTVTTFYSFEVVNTKGGEYQFWKYDDSAASPWTEIWHQPFGTEFHEGHGAQSVNTFKVFANGSHFTFTVNGKVVKTAQDTALTNGTIGMIVNLNGTEVAFKNLLLTNN